VILASGVKLFEIPFRARRSSFCHPGGPAARAVDHGPVVSDLVPAVDMVCKRTSLASALELAQPAQFADWRD
jgi:hypothetical protein